MKPIRSFLFVPGSRASWIDKIPGYHADAVILDDDRRMPFVPTELHLDEPLVRRELDSVGDQVDHYLLQALRVGDQQRDAAIEPAGYLDVPGVGVGPDSVYGRLDDGDQMRRRPMQLELS